MKGAADTPENAAVTPMRRETGKQVKTKMKAEFETGGQKVEVDFSDMEKRLEGKMQKYFEQLEHTVTEQKDKNGKGVVEAYLGDEKKNTILEEFKKGERMDAGKIREQWTVTIPKARAELAGHLRDFVWVTDIVKGAKGETVNIPYVYDIDFVREATPHTGGSLTGKTGLINVLTTTLHEAGAYYDAYYGDIEKIDGNMLDELNRVFAHAAVRAEDEDLVGMLNTLTLEKMSSRSGDSQIGALYVGTTCSTMDADLIIDALGVLMARGKEVHPGECIAVMTGPIWAELMKDIIGSTPLVTADSRAAATGILESLLGVKIVVVGCDTKSHVATLQPGASSYNMCYLMRPKRALALAPKRDILIETDKLIKERQLRIAGSHTYGTCAIDPTEVVVIRTDADPVT